MKFSDSFLDEIKARLSVSQVVGRRVPLKKAGREWKGLSPFNAEKTPSFTVNDQKGFYHCFSSGKHGDIFTFLMETEGLSFPEAVERLAGEAGMPLPAPDPRAERASQERKGLREALEAAAKLYRDAFHGQGGAAARAYAENRGLLPDTLDTFRIGYAPGERGWLKSALLKQGFAEAQQREAGLLIKPDDGRETYDRFRNRLMIPIGDSRGRIVGFGARTLASDVEPKYLNSPETRLFDKGTLVYNFARARASAFERSELIVVEGYMDVISLYQAGFANVVATLGTAFTERQMAQLWQLAPEPVICFDGDRAGEAAAYRAIDRMLPVLREGHSFRFAFMPKDMDPDDLVRVEGPQAFSACLARAKPLIDAFWTRELSGRTLDTPERRAALEQDFEQHLALIGNVRVRDHYRRELKNRLWQLWRARPSGRQQTSVTAAGFGSTAPPAIAVNQFGREALLVLACLTHPWLIERFAEELSALHLRHSRLAALLAEAMDIVGERHGLDREALEAALAETPHAALLEQLRAQSGHARVGFARPETARLEVEAQFGQFLFLWKDMPALRQELDQAAAGLAEASEAEFERFMALQEQVASAEVQHPEDTHERDSLKRFEETVARLRKERSAALRGRRSLHQS